MGCSPASADMPSGTILLANVSAASVSMCSKLLRLLGKIHKLSGTCSLMSEEQLTAMPGPLSWGPRGAWEWVNFAKPLWGPNNWNNQRKGLSSVTCGIIEQLTDLVNMFDRISNVLFAYYSDGFSWIAAQGIIIIQALDFLMARMWSIQIPYDIRGHMNCQLKTNFNGKKRWKKWSITS